MTQRLFAWQSRSWRRRGAPIVILLSLLLAVTPVRAAVYVIDPAQPPTVTLSREDAQKLTTLQSAFYSPLLSDVSPDDAAILTVAPQASVGLAFLNLHDRTFTPVSAGITAYQQISEFRWHDAKTLAFIGIDQNQQPALVTIARDTGAVTATAFALPGFPISLAPNATRVLVALVVGAQGGQPNQLRSPFTTTSKRPAFRHVGPATFDYEERLAVRVASVQIQLAVIDIASRAQTPLVDIAPDTAIYSIAWSPDASQLAMVRSIFPNFARGKASPPLSDPSTQDGLGRLAPANNPFLQSNVVDTFDLSTNTLRPAVLRAAKGNGDIFVNVVWSPDGKTLLTTLWAPGTPKGRPYPTYINPNRSYLRFYSPAGKLLGTLDRPEIEAPFASVATFISPDEVVVSAAFGLSWGLFSYNRKTHEFRRLATEEGTIYQSRPTNQSRQMIVWFASFLHPPEIYRIGLNDARPSALTQLNAAVAAVNRVRADKVSFTLDGGVRRTGYLIQRRGADFPPRDVRMVVWQQGGPTGPVTSDWGGFVEAPYNLLPNFGFAVLVVPLPGREGFGPDFLDGLADRRNFGQIDIAEQAQISRRLIAQGYTSRERLGITGCSYGGYFTTQSIAQYPDLYAAANTQCTLLDLFDEWQFGFKPYLSYLMGRTPVEDPQEYIKDSPLYNADRIRTPLLIFSGTEDFLPYTLSQNLHDAVAANRTPADFYLFRGEGHGLRQPNSEFIAGQAQLTWFRHYLKQKS